MTRCKMILIPCLMLLLSACATTDTTSGKYDWDSARYDDHISSGGTF